jgi:BirA family biotin operon repressor/biotin-[acetyl-CoA-carboxylase] ligase
MQTRLEAAIRTRSPELIRRIIVVDEAASTQDAAQMLAGGEPGLMLIARLQTGGRGRLGRVWTQKQELGLAATCVLDARRFDPGTLSLAAGLAAVETVNEAVPRGSGSPRIGVRWPNDVVECGQGRKLAGVLVEVRAGVALVGIGINVMQCAGDWPEALRGRAVSILELGGTASRDQVAERLMLNLDSALRLDESALVEQWTQRDVLVGTIAEFMSGGRRVRGRVDSIAPTHEIVVKTDDGRRERLPAATTSLIQPEPPQP